MNQLLSRQNVMERRIIFVATIARKSFYLRPLVLTRRKSLAGVVDKNVENVSKGC